MAYPHGTGGPLQSSSSGLPLRMWSPEEVEGEIQRRVDSERQRLEAERAPAHFVRLAERPFTAAERDRVTILFGGLTWKQAELACAAFRSAGYRVESLPTPDAASFRLGKEFGNTGQCNPTYFMVGHLIKYLQSLEAQGLSKQDIVDRYVFFTAGSCGPCRFGMYESEYRLALANAGFERFRVLLFQQDDGITAGTGEAGLRFTLDFALGALNALTFGDVLNDVCCQLRPYEVEAGQTDRLSAETVAALSKAIRDRRMFHVSDRMPAWMAQRILANHMVESVVHTTGKVVEHLWGRHTKEALHAARERLSQIEVDRLRVKPIVKIVGEFFAQTTEGDGNFRMIEFLEREGAEVRVEPIANWILYLLWQPKARNADRKWVGKIKPKPWQVTERAQAELAFLRTQMLLDVGERLYMRVYRQAAEGLGGIAHPLLDMQELADVAEPYYHPFSRGGEGHLEVAKSIYYTVQKKAHMVLSLKPFGCMPSSQSDGVHSAVMSHFKDMIFLPVETSGEGEVNAHSRVQMALGEAKAKAKHEFQLALESTGRSLDEIRTYVADHAELRAPFYRVPHQEGVAGTAANFVLHVGDLMGRRARPRRMVTTRASAVPAPVGRV